MKIGKEFKTHFSFCTAKLLLLHTSIVMLFDLRDCFLPPCEFQTQHNSCSLSLSSSSVWIELFSAFIALCARLLIFLQHQHLFTPVPFASPLLFTEFAPFTHTTKPYIGKHCRPRYREGMRRPRARITTPFSFFLCCLLPPKLHSTYALRILKRVSLLLSPKTRFSTPPFSASKLQNPLRLESA